VADVPAAILILAQPAGLAKAAGAKAEEITESPGYADNLMETARFFGLFFLIVTFGKVEAFRPAPTEHAVTMASIV